MKRATLFGISLVLLFALMRLAMLGWHGALCRSPVISDPAWQKVRLPAGPCWEFWANRYQTGIGAAVAIAAATLAWRGTQRQLAAERVKTLRQDLYTTLRVRTLNRRIAEYLGQQLDVNRIREVGERGAAFEVARRLADDGLLDIKTAQSDRAVVSDLYQTLIMSTEFRSAVDAFRDAAREAHCQSKRLYALSSRSIGSSEQNCDRSALITLAELSRPSCDPALENLNSTYRDLHAALTEEVARLEAEIKALLR